LTAQGGGSAVGSVGLKAQRRRVVDEGSDDEMPEPEAKRKKDGGVAAGAKRGYNSRMTDSSSPGTSMGRVDHFNCDRAQHLLSDGPFNLF
jgi:hypothetical protein